MKAFALRLAVSSVVLVGLPWGASALGTAVTGVSDAQLTDPHACPNGAHLTWYEDGSGGCYPDAPTRGEIDQYPLTRADGSAWTWPEDTFGPWDCATMGNKICGPTFTGVDVYPDGSAVQYVNDEEVRTFPAGTFSGQSK